MEFGTPGSMEGVQNTGPEQSQSQIPSIGNGGTTGSEEGELDE
jgi:protein BUR2